MHCAGGRLMFRQCLLSQAEDCILYVAAVQDSEGQNVITEYLNK